MQDMQVQSLGREDPPGEGNGNRLQYSCLQIAWTEEPGRVQSIGYATPLLDATVHIQHGRERDLVS